MKFIIDKREFYLILLDSSNNEASFFLKNIWLKRLNYIVDLVEISIFHQYKYAYNNNKITKGDD